MSTPAERLASPELLSVEEADNYIKAACLVLGRGDIGKVPDIDIDSEMYGEDGTLLPDANCEIMLARQSSNPSEYTIEPSSVMSISYAAEWGDSFQVSQAVEDEPNLAAVIERVILPGSEQAEYVAAQGGQHVSHDDEALYDAAYATIVSDFRSALEEKLIDRPDLRDAIQWTSQNLPHNQSVER